MSLKGEHALAELYPAIPAMPGHPVPPFQAMYEASIADPDVFWTEQARTLLAWFRDFKTVQQGGFDQVHHITTPTDNSCVDLPKSNTES